MAPTYNKIQLLKIKQELTKQLQLIASLTGYPNITNEIETMQKMINEILSSSMGILDIAQQKKCNLNVVTLLRNLCTRMQLDGYNVSFMSNTTSAMCCANDIVLKRIFENIISNAIKYAHIAKINLTTQDDSITITIDDDGPGIPEHELNNVFEPFYRVNNATTANTKGSGVGLAFTKLAVLIYHGTVSLENLPGRGLRATVTFPVLISQNQSSNLMKNSEQMANNTLVDQAYIIKLAALSHDVLNLTTRIRLRTERLEDYAKKREIDEILDKMEGPMREILAMSKSKYLLSQFDSIEKIAAAAA